MSELTHYGTPRHSGRYPWGSGEDPAQRNKTLLSRIDELKRQGLSETEIASGLGMSTTELRARKKVANSERRKAEVAEAIRLKETGMSTSAIAREMGKNESSVRGLLDKDVAERASITENVANVLRENVENKTYIDVGAGVERWMNISEETLKTSVQMLQDEGYTVHYLKQEQAGNPGKFTSFKVLAPPGSKYSDFYDNRDQIQNVYDYSYDGGRTMKVNVPPKNIDSKRIGVRYGDEGGSDKDGVIELRRGVDDISLGNANYAQVRIAVDGTHYLKGMAMYSDKMPDGVDIVFNTNKKNTGNKLDAMKPIKEGDPVNPFGSAFKQKEYTDASGKKQLSPLNIVNEEGDWAKWSKNLSSQMLAKQSKDLAKQQLGLAYDLKKAEFDEIKSLTNPAVKKKLLESFGDDCDSAAVHLKAAALPGTINHVILPITSMKENEVYAPRYKNGETVVLIRHPHGGIFEIPELTVNNNNKEAKQTITNKAVDAIGIHPKVASKLSGADFDGDTVLVIPNNGRKIKSAPSLESLKDFDPKKQYAAYPGMKPVANDKNVWPMKQRQMGEISNLITDMTIKGADFNDIGKAVKHSMVIIDAEKHNLNYKQSYIDNNIGALKAKWQTGGASTLMSRAKATEHIPERKDRPAALGGRIDPVTGKRMYVETGDTYIKNGKVIPKTTKVSRMAKVDDAFDLVSAPTGTVMEAVYATHANKLKALGNEARKEFISTPPMKYQPSAAKAYSNEVSSLKHKLNLALKNAPLERQAQLLAASMSNAKIQANPDLPNSEKKMIRGQDLVAARARTGADKHAIELTQNEWNAIQSGAVSHNMQTEIFRHANIDQVKKYAMPRTASELGATKIARANSMLNQGYTQAEVAAALGVSTSTLNKALN